jgi:phosphatidylglycerol:prolipoprotein diacylglycerol transferase
LYPILLSIGNFHLTSSVFFLILGILAGILAGSREARRLGFNNRKFHQFWMWAVPLALLFGALNSLVFAVGLLPAVQNPGNALSSGLVSYGAILGAFLVCYLYLKIIKREDLTGVAFDTIAVVLPLILGIYRIGCLLNGCCYGLETDGPLGMYLPGQHGEWATRYPTQIMLMVFNLGLFAWLWSRRKAKAFDGSLTLAFLFIYSLGRLVIDAFRDLPHVLGPFSLHQLTAIAIMIITAYIAFELRLARYAKTA